MNRGESGRLRRFHSPFSPIPILDTPVRFVLIGCGLLLLAVASLAVFERHALIVDVQQDALVLQQLASQRADQHDAHLTSLSAVATLSDGNRRDVLLELATTIARFYPRIDEMQLIPLHTDEAVIGTETPSAILTERIRAAARDSAGATALLPHPDKPDHYMLVKRSPNTAAARYGLMLGIDAKALLADTGAFWSRPGTQLQLALPDGHLLFTRGGDPGAFTSSHALSSASQPLVLTTGAVFGLADLLPPFKLAALLAGVALAYLAAFSILGHRARTRRAMAQARLSALDSRLAHASRVNTLGEMASGLAHELTQPLTAILAQAQAGRRLLAQGKTAALGDVLEDTVQQARRGSAMLERFRHWSRPQPSAAVSFDLREAVTGVQALLQPRAVSVGCQVAIDMPAEPVPVVADPIEMEQVVFNLVRNALDATADLGVAGRIAVSVQQSGHAVTLVVHDNGPGVSPDLRARLFSPFTTTRADGTGLGLALSQRLVERAGGELVWVEGGPGATFRVVLPCAPQPGAATP